MKVTFFVTKIQFEFCNEKYFYIIHNRITSIIFFLCDKICHFKIL